MRPRPTSGRARASGDEPMPDWTPWLGLV
jgi:hypothetical protein